jgi:hypothetical protein
MKKLLVFPLLLVCCVGAAQAWNKPGHMTVGAIAYYELKQKDPVALAAVINMLKNNSWYQTKWLPALNQIQDNDPDKEGLYLFMWAARWPDDVRGTPLHCEKCHYINYPFKPAGQPNSVVAHAPDPQNILAAFISFSNGVQQGTAAKRAEALCWIFHLVGDVHQPLHTTALFTTMFPQGDRGGTIFFIRANEDSPTQSLHSFWDEQIITSERFSLVRARARALLARSDLQRNQLTELSETHFDKWGSVESFNAAKRFGYLNGALKGSTDPGDGEFLPEHYANDAKGIAERRAVAAGYRLADLLSQRF